jgi:hypothetical protein
MGGMSPSRALNLLLTWVPAALLGGAVLFAAAQLAAMPLAVASGLAALAVSYGHLQRYSAAPMALPAFDLALLAFPESPGELLLTEVHVPAAGPSEVVGGDELLLDDVFVALGPDSRVVRLFDPPPLPTAGELGASIDRHLQSQRKVAPPDASQALSDALTELRRSLASSTR